MYFEKKVVLLLLGVIFMAYEFSNIIVGILRERKIKRFNAYRPYMDNIFSEC